MARLTRLVMLAALSLGMLELLENLQNDLSGATVRGHLTDDDRSQLLEINGVLAVNLGRQRNKKPVDEKELRSSMKEIEKLVRKKSFADADAARVNMDLGDLKHALRHR